MLHTVRQITYFGAENKLLKPSFSIKLISQTIDFCLDYHVKTLQKPEICEMQTTSETNNSLAAKFQWVERGLSTKHATKWRTLLSIWFNFVYRIYINAWKSCREKNIMQNKSLIIIKIYSYSSQITWLVFSYTWWKYWHRNCVKVNGTGDIARLFVEQRSTITCFSLFDCVYWQSSLTMNLSWTWTANGFVDKLHPAYLPKSEQKDVIHT